MPAKKIWLIKERNDAAAPAAGVKAAEKIEPHTEYHRAGRLDSVAAKRVLREVG
ncbi:MAG: hypothetical protein ACREQO_16940 [Candidatus Binatia bacterium]